MRRRLGFLFGALCAAVVALGLCIPKWEGSETLSLPLRLQIWQQWHQAETLLDKGADRDGKEQSLTDGGLAVLDSDGVYPEYLANPEKLHEFSENAQRGKRGSASVFRITETGKLRHLLFCRQKEQTWLYTTEEETGKLQTTILPVYDMELADWGIFYYRCYPAGDPHYIDYSQIRMAPADRESWDLNRKFVRFMGYQFVNLFLIDWQEGDWERLSFADTLDSFYEARTGDKLGWEQLGFSGTAARVQIPGRIFEESICPYFAIDLETFRKLTDYDEAAGTYPWRPIQGDDITPWHYPLCEPEVTSWRENADGTLTLEVQVYSPDLKTDRLFCHEVTVRPLKEGFQYVSNRVTYISPQGLPPAMPRFQLDGR